MGISLVGWPASGPGAEPTPVPATRILIRYSASADPAQTERKYHLQFLKVIPGTAVRVYLLSGPEPSATVMEKLRREPGVELVEEDYLQEKQ